MSSTLVKSKKMRALMMADMPRHLSQDLSPKSLDPTAKKRNVQRG